MTRLAAAPPELLTVKEAAARVRVDESTIHRWMAERRLRRIQKKKRGAIRIRLEDLLATAEGTPAHR